MNALNKYTQAIINRAALENAAYFIDAAGVRRVRDVKALRRYRAACAKVDSLRDVEPTRAG